MKGILIKYQRLPKKVLLVGGIILWLPIQAFYSYQKNHYQQSQQDMLTLQQNMQHLLRLQSIFSSPALAKRTQSLDEVIQQSAQKHHLPLHSVSLEERGIVLELSSLPFSQLILWLGELQREQDIRTIYLQVEEIATGEKVRVNKLILQGVTET